MNAYVGVTDFEWYKFLHGLNPPPEEVNFWQPSGGRMTGLAEGSPFVFKLHKARGGSICGFGLYGRGTKLPIREAWSFFGASNGVGSMKTLLDRVTQYRRKQPGHTVTMNDEIGCHLILAPVFFPQELWVKPPSDWADSIVQGRGKPLDDPEMGRIWHECVERAQMLTLGSQTRLHLQEATDDFRYGAPRLVAPRLGQGTFRSAVLDAYGRACAVTNEHSVPVLEAAHIYPYSSRGTHDVSNGLLLRSDIHRLFDTGYVSVSPDGLFQVSPRLKEDFNNGVTYYAMKDRRIILPDDPRKHPDRDLLRWHNENVFIAA